MMDSNMDLLRWSINVWIKTSSNGIKKENISNKELTQELLKAIIKKS